MEYSVDNSKVASVSANGVVTAKKAGKAVITAKKYSSLKLECIIHIHVQFMYIQGNA